ncbi:NDFIP1 (predicted) [Pycnogonum litorale]
MESTARYHLLENEEEVQDHNPQSITEQELRNPCSDEVSQSSFPVLQPDDEEPCKLPTEILPEYHVATDLPSYEDVERAKITEESRRDREEADLLATESALLGTDFLFFTSFLVAFLFNWMGFLLVLCFCHTVAGRYGALAGFGLSLSKWMLIVKHSTNLMNHENDWLWWLVMSFGILICVRASLQYVRAKREWRHLSPNAQERLFYFY